MSNKRHIKDTNDMEQLQSRNPRVEKLCQVYEKWLHNGAFWPDDNERYHRTVEKIRGLEYSAHDIRQFSLQLQRYQDIDDKCKGMPILDDDIQAPFKESTGSFLAALINTSEESDFEIITKPLNTLLNC